MNYKIHPIFPLPIYETFLNRDFLKKEENFFLNLESKKNKNTGNYGSAEECSYVLDKKPLKNLKNDLNKIIHNYCETIIDPKNKIKLYITQSWLNWTSYNEHHHEHYHPNSLISGVLYIKTVKNDGINFSTPHHSFLKITPNKFNFFNTTDFFFEVCCKKIILFPSFLRHNVPKNFTNDTRCSLAFNIFIKGTLGESKNATELILK